MKEADKYGGEEKDWEVYTKPDEEPYFDKLPHWLRSVTHSTNHLKQFRKIKRINKKPDITISKPVI